MPAKRFRFTKASFFILLLVIFFGAAAIFLFLKLRTDPIGAELNKGDTLELLLMVGEDEELLFSEMIFLQADTGKCAVFDIPTNIGTLISSKNRMDRIDSVFEKGNPQEYITQLEELIDISISHHLYISKENFEKLIDLFEGVELFIANPVEETKEANENRHILIPSGSVSLDGPKAVSYSLYESTGGPRTDRVTRRQKVVQAILKKIGEMENYSTSAEVLDTANSLFRGNISERAFASLFEGLSAIEEDQFIFQRALGKERNVDGKRLLFPHYEGTLLKETVKQMKKTLSNKEVMSTEQLNVTLEILNGTTTNGLAGRTSQVFESFGYDVARVANAQKQDREDTTVIARTGNISAAQQVAKIIKCTKVVTEEEKISEKLTGTAGNEPIDVTVILGKDFDGRYCKK